MAKPWEFVIYEIMENLASELVKAGSATVRVGSP
jgi:hypothetical protein